MARKIKFNGWKKTALTVLATIAVTTVFKLMQDQLIENVEQRIDNLD